MKNYVGVDIGCTKIYICATVNGECVEKSGLTGLDCPKEKIKKEIDEFIERLPFTPEGVGIAVPGLIDGNCRVEFSDINSLSNVTTEYFSNNRFKVKFINDVRAAAIAEAENYKMQDTVAVIMVGSGLAVSVYSKGRIFTGAKGFAGELGYCLMETEDGPKTVDILSGGFEILRRSGGTINELLEKINKKDKDALTLINKAGYYFGIVLSNVMHLFNPDVIVVGGSTSTYEGYMEKAIKTAKEYTLKDIYNCCTIVKPKDPKRIVALGALEYIKMFEQKYK